MDRNQITTALFGAPRALIGVIHVGALPGAPAAHQSIAELVDDAITDARTYATAGFHAVLLENMHDRPYLKRDVGPEVVAGMTAVGREVRRAVELPLGVQVLAGANRAALAVALACGAAFVRAEGFVFGHVADEGSFESDAGELLRYRKAIGAEAVRVFVDVKKKHSSHAITADVNLVDTAHAAEFFLADAVVVTGSATGKAASPTEVRSVARSVGIPTAVGSGITAGNLGRYWSAQLFIVGSSIKRDGAWSQPADPRRCGELARAFRELSQTSRRA